jgi:hypothetical protein
LYPAAHGCRLVSRWRVDWQLTLATAFWVPLGRDTQENVYVRRQNAR